MKLPKQTVPVVRSTTGSPIANSHGVEASFGWGDIWEGVKTYGPDVVKGVASLL